MPDPEIPVLSVVDLGIVRHVRRGGDGRLHVGLTPTYSGCPATEVIRGAVRSGARPTRLSPMRELEEVLSPPWSSDWLTPRRAARSCGRSASRRPLEAVASPRRLWQASPVACPRCASADTERVSEFGSTPCKAHYRCRACLEPFDYFKCI